MARETRYVRRHGPFLAVGGGSAGIFPKKLAMRHKDAGQEMFLGHPFKAAEVVGYSYGSLVYSVHGGQKQLQNM